MLTTVPDLFTCLSPAAEKADRLDYTDILNRYKEQFPVPVNGTQITRMENLWGGLHSNYSSYILAFNEVKLSGAIIEGPRIGVCAASAELKDTILQSSAHGCPSDFGIGKGQQFATCAGSGGSNGGQGGYGGLESDVKKHQDVCKQHKTEAYLYGIDSKYEGSGGASGTTNSPLGGAGGGIIRIQILNGMNLNRS